MSQPDMTCPDDLVNGMLLEEVVREIGAYTVKPLQPFTNPDHAAIDEQRRIELHMYVDRISPTARAALHEIARLFYLGMVVSESGSSPIH